MRAVDIIAKKRDGQALSKEEIEWFIREYTCGNVADYQASAFAMAVYFQGMTDKETAYLTAAMRDSGERIDLSVFGGKTVDKHSTGGVGDKTTLIVAPIVASLGGKVAKMSGRGLGHTGGTVDKLESIPGYKTELTREEFINQVKNIGVAVIGQSGNLAPADKKLYALRDVTATVNSIPLIASSIMSKKLAAGTDSIVLDVKVGSGAFMKTEAEAEALAQKMVDIGYNCGKKVSALITQMDVPLGFNIGNALEVKEAVEVLSSNGAYDLTEICTELAANMLSLCNNWEISFARERVKEVLENGAALEKFKEWISAQGGDISVLDNMDEFCPALYSSEFVSAADGYISFMDAERLGVASMLLGAGRANKDDKIDNSAGIVLSHKTGDYVKKGEKIATMYSSVVSDFSAAEKILSKAISISAEAPKSQKLILKTVTK